MTPPVLLCAPPWRTPYDASLAVATLRPILERAGLRCEELHGALLFPVTSTPLTFLEQFSGWVFAPCFDPGLDREQLADALVAQYVDDCECGGLVPWSDRLDLPALRTSVLQDMARADVCISGCVEAALATGADIVGFSATFESQIPAALAIAIGLKARDPSIKVVLGGAACFEVQGLGLAASFPTLVDAVCHAEGEDVIVPLVQALRGQTPLAAVPGVAWSERGFVRSTPAPPTTRDLDALPFPAYDGWVEAHARSVWSGMYPPKLFFESSRGCWWGQKHLCSFCGLNATGLPFRAKSADRVVAEIEHLWHRFPQIAYLQATDNILDMDYLKSVLPRLAPLVNDPVRPLQMFFEIKSNLRKDQVRVLADGGIVDVQPGIESLSDEVLGLMNKGATGLGQIQLIKWAAEQGIGLVYNLLVNSPGEQAAWYDAMTALIPSLEQLPPPMGVAPIRLERFSPYHQQPERYGIHNVRPAAYYRLLYRDPAVDLDRMAYTFDYDHVQHQDAALRTAYLRFISAVVRWQERYAPGRAFYTTFGEAVQLTDRRDGRSRTHVLTGAAANMWREADRIRPRRVLGDGLDPEIVDAAIETWQARRWLVSIGHRVIAVLPDSAARPTPAPVVETSPHVHSLEAAS